MTLLVLMLIVTGVYCQQQEVRHVTLQRDTVSAVFCPLKTTKQVTWAELAGGQRGIPWGRHLIFTNVQGPENQLYRCEVGDSSALVNVTLSDGTLNTVDGTIDYCQHGKPCALTCSLNKEGAMDWPGMALDKELWWGEKWDGVHIKGENPTMISPSVVAADLTRNPSLIACKRLYHITETGRELTGLPVGHAMQGRIKKMEMTIKRPYSHIVRPICKDLTKTVVIPATVGQRLEVECEGIAWSTFDDMYWLQKPCRDNKCETMFIPTEGRTTEQSMNTTLVENLLGYPVSKKLVFDPVHKSDLESTFYCKLDSTGSHDIVTVFLKKQRNRRSPPFFNLSKVN